MGLNLGNKDFPFIVAMMRDYASQSGQVLPISTATIARSPFSRTSIAFIAGFTLGAAVGVFGVKFGTSFLSVNRRSDRLIRELESIQRNLEQRNCSSVSSSHSGVVFKLKHFFFYHCFIIPVS